MFVHKVSFTVKRNIESCRMLNRSTKTRTRAKSCSSEIFYYVRSFLIIFRFRSSI